MRTYRSSAGLLVFIVSLSICISAGEKPRVGIISISGTYQAAIKQYPFPLTVETSSLYYDESDHTFYTTADKGPVHLMKFKLEKDSIKIIRSGAIKGLARNYDLEGVTIAGEKKDRYLLISTERWRKKDSIVIFGADLKNWTYLPDKTFAVTTPGIKENNNFEGVTYDSHAKSIYFVKEHTPYALFSKPESGSSVTTIFSEAGFQPFYDRFVDSVFSKILDTSTIRRLHPVAFADIAYDADTENLLILNRFGRAIIQVKLTEGEKPGWTIVSVWPYFGVDDTSVPGLTDEDYLFGQAEGLAVVGHGSGRTLALIRDPGTGNRSILTLFPYPGK
ncbi:MAG: SdiA-regulated domain-containing protein [Candidatus Zixiibacteriota bacterium]